MASLRSLDDERAEMERDLDQARREYERLSFNAARVEREGGDADYVGRIREQAETCRRWIGRITSNLREAA